MAPPREPAGHYIGRPGGGSLAASPRTARVSGVSTDRFTRPPGLRPGDRIAVVAPASAFDRPSFEAGLAVLAARYRPVFDPGCFARTRYLAGDDSRRLDELTAALADDSVKAIVAARGGYGTLRLVADLWPKLRAAAFPPKPVVGFSDVTALHAVLQAAGWVSIHGPVVTQLGAQDRKSCV